MRGNSCAVLAGAAASILLTAASPPAEDAARQWALVEREGSAPERSLLFVDRGSLRRDGDNASARAALVFESPQEGGIKGFEVSYDFRCGARQQRRHDIIFTQADGAAQPSALPPAGWSTVAPDTPTAAVHAIACGGAFPAGAVSIAGTPAASASRFFPATQMANAAPAARTPRLVPRDELVCRLQHGETPAQVSAHPDPAPAACRGAALAAGRATARPVLRVDAYAELLDRIVRADSQDWAVNSYGGDMEIVNVQRDEHGNVTMLRGNYRYGSNPRLYGTILGGSGGGSSRFGWVEAHFANGRLQCLQYHDRAGCIASTRDYYQQGNDAAAEHYEYCAITRNC
jgi:hypothetical protein